MSLHSPIELSTHTVIYPDYGALRDLAPEDETPFNPSTGIDIYPDYDAFSDCIDNVELTSSAKKIISILDEYRHFLNFVSEKISINPGRSLYEYECHPYFWNHKIKFIASHILRKAKNIIPLFVGLYTEYKIETHPDDAFKKNPIFAHTLGVVASGMLGIAAIRLIGFPINALENRFCRVLYLDKIDMLDLFTKKETDSNVNKIKNAMRVFKRYENLSVRDMNILARILDNNSDSITNERALFKAMYYHDIFITENLGRAIYMTVTSLDENLINLILDYAIELFPSEI